ncbi:EutN/CcmL family microcompartment protein [Mycolicibacterium sp.]|uniref:EutN/CcmL family microcompartment protein n=1 Tax=Mycolicibacterium sp. TaxID=2320850 RepID=UPI00356868D2
MLIGDVVGTVTAPEQVSSLRSQRLLVVKRAQLTGNEEASYEVAVDLVGAGPGTRVLMVAGSAARLAPETRTVATDLAIVAIVDSVDLTEGLSVRAALTNRSAKS